MSGKKLQLVFRNPVLVSNLLLRIVLLVFVVVSGHWHGGDTPHYLGFAKDVCGGEWGGEANRGPFYLWFLCLLSPDVSQQAASTQLLIPLFVQTLLVWFGGVWIFFSFSQEKKLANLLAAFWLFDPVFLIYSNIVMSDVLFGLSLLGVIFRMKRILTDRPTSWDYAILGALLAVSALIRAVAIPLILLTLVLVIVKRSRITHWMILVAVLFACIAPRLYWNKTRFGVLNIANQGESWMMSVAGVVENHGKGLDFFESEAKWFKDHQNRDKWETYRSLIQNFPKWVLLSLKGMARVLFGHVNIEWAIFFTGEAPLGPAWFKVQENRAGNQVQGFGLVAWVLGLFATAISAGFVYWNGLSQFFLWCGKFREIKREHLYFVAWSILAAIFMAVTPQVFGDARFRTAVWPFVLVVWGFLFCENKKRKNV